MNRDAPMIVTGRRGSDLLLTYHAINHLDRSFASIRAENPSAKYRYLHLNDVYLYR